MKGMRVAMVASLFAVWIAGCSSPGSNTSVGHEQFTFSCCTGLNDSKIWLAGETLAFHWTEESSGSRSDVTGIQVTLTAVLAGPYLSVALLKSGGAHAETIRSPAIAASSTTNSNPISTIALPADLPAGWYDVAFTADSATGNGMSSATVIQVARPTG